MTRRRTGCQRSSNNAPGRIFSGSGTTEAVAVATAFVAERGRGQARSRRDAGTRSQADSLDSYLHRVVLGISVGAHPKNINDQDAVSPSLGRSPAENLDLHVLHVADNVLAPSVGAPALLQLSAVSAIS